MNQTAHTSSAFERDLVELNGALVRLGMLASKQLNGSLRAMSDFQENRIEMLIDRTSNVPSLWTSGNRTLCQGLNNMHDRHTCRKQGRN